VDRGKFSPVSQSQYPLVPSALLGAPAKVTPPVPIVEDSDESHIF
jgi:hypothetical protein